MGPVEAMMKGMAVTLRQFVSTVFGKGLVTIKYPAEMREKPQRFHGRHVLNRYEDGMEKCIGCELCAGACPAHCIYVRGADNPEDAPISPGERFGFIYEINLLRCIFCGLCVEACPTEAITHSQLFEMSTTNRADAIYTKTELLVDRDGTPNHMFESDRFADLTELAKADGWMRATSPQGRVAYEGVVAWTASAGVGVRSPEAGQSQAPVDDQSEAAVDDPPDDDPPDDDPPDDARPDDAPGDGDDH